MAWQQQDVQWPWPAASVHAPQILSGSALVMFEGECRVAEPCTFWSMDLVTEQWTRHGVSVHIESFNNDLTSMNSVRVKGDLLLTGDRTVALLSVDNSSATLHGISSSQPHAAAGVSSDPEGRESAAMAVLVQGKSAVLFGGVTLRSSASTFVFHSSTWFLDLRRLSWMEHVGVSPDARQGHTMAVASRGSAYVFGGSTCHPLLSVSNLQPAPCGASAITYNDVWILGGESLSWSKASMSGAVPLPREAHSAVAYQEKILIFGGVDLSNFDGTGETAFEEMKILDTADNSWTDAQLMFLDSEVRPAAWSFQSAIMLENKLLVFGGIVFRQNGLDVSGELWAFEETHPGSSVWKGSRLLDGSDSLARAAHSAIVVGSSVWLFGGLTKGSACPKEEFCGLAPSDDVVRMQSLRASDTAHWVWDHIETANAPQPRVSHVGLLAGGDLLVFGGTSSYSFGDVRCLPVASLVAEYDAAVGTHISLGGPHSSILLPTAF
eukprot:1309347-Rhodomonas_salina.1